MQRPALFVILGLVLTACGTQGEVPVDQTRTIGSFALNVEGANKERPTAEITSLGGLRAQNAEISGLTFAPLSFSTFNYLPTGKRYLRASFLMTNKSGRVLNSPTLLPLIMEGQSGTIGGTPFSKVEYFDRSSAAELAPQFVLLAAKELNKADGRLIDVRGATRFAGPFNTAQLDIPAPAETVIKSVGEFGWMANTQADEESQVVTFAAEMPIPADPTKAAYSFSLSFTVIDSPVLK